MAEHAIAHFQNDHGVALIEIGVTEFMCCGASDPHDHPHVYLDTVILIGGLAASWEGALRVAFAVGAVTSSFVWFFGLGYGARLLAPVFEKPVSWRVLDTMIAVVMAWLGLSLVWPLLG